MPAPVGPLASAAQHASVSPQRPARPRAVAPLNGERVLPGLFDEQPGCRDSLSCGLKRFGIKDELQQGSRFPAARATVKSDSIPRARRGSE